MFLLLESQGGLATKIFSQLTNQTCVVYTIYSVGKVSLYLLFHVIINKENLLFFFLFFFLIFFLSFFSALHIICFVLLLFVLLTP